MYKVLLKVMKRSRVLTAQLEGLVATLDDDRDQVGMFIVYNLSNFVLFFSQRLAEFEKKIFALVTDTVCSGNKSRIFFV